MGVVAADVAQREVAADLGRHEMGSSQETISLDRQVVEERHALRNEAGVETGNGVPPGRPGLEAQRSHDDEDRHPGTVAARECQKGRAQREDEQGRCGELHRLGAELAARVEDCRDERTESEEQPARTGVPPGAGEGIDAQAREQGEGQQRKVAQARQRKTIEDRCLAQDLGQLGWGGGERDAEGRDRKEAAGEDPTGALDEDQGRDRQHEGDAPDVQRPLREVLGAAVGGLVAEGTRRERRGRRGSRSDSRRGSAWR